MKIGDKVIAYEKYKGVLEKFCENEKVVVIKTGNASRHYFIEHVRPDINVGDFVKTDFGIALIDFITPPNARIKFNDGMVLYYLMEKLQIISLIPPPVIK